MLEHNGFEVEVPSRTAAGCRCSRTACSTTRASVVLRLARALAPARARRHDHRRQRDELHADAQARGARDPRPRGRPRPDARQPSAPTTSASCCSSCHDRGELQDRLQPDRRDGRLPRAVPAAGPLDRQAGARAAGADPAARRSSRSTRAAAASPAPTGSRPRSTTSRWRSAPTCSTRSRASGAASVACDSETCRWQIEHGTGRPSAHPIELLHRAYRPGNVDFASISTNDLTQPETVTSWRPRIGRTGLLAVGTGVRIVLAPVVMALVLHGSDTAATIVFLVAAATDWFDGRLARRWEVTTRLGSFLDTTADKLLVSVALIALLAVDRVSPWVVALIVSRELDPARAARRGRRRGAAHRDLDARQVEGDGAVRRDRAGDAPPRRDDRRRVPRPVGDGRSRRSSRCGRGTTTSSATCPRCARRGEPRLRHRRQRRRRGRAGRARWSARGDEVVALARRRRRRRSCVRATAPAGRQRRPVRRRRC